MNLYELATALSVPYPYDKQMMATSTFEDFRTFINILQGQSIAMFAFQLQKVSKVPFKKYQLIMSSLKSCKQKVLNIGKKYSNNLGSMCSDFNG